MKNYVIYCFILFTSVALSQQNENKLTYEEVIQAENVSKDDLYNRARLWFANSFKNSNAVLQIDDKNEGQLVGKANIPYKPSMLQQSEQSKGAISFTFSVYLKDGRYKYEVSNFIHEPVGNSYGTFSVGIITDSEKFPDQNAKQQNLRNKVWLDVKAQIDKNIKPLIEELKGAMLRSVENKKEW